MVDNIAHHTNINHSSDKPQIAMVDNIVNHNNINHSPDKPQIAMVDDIAHHNNINHSSNTRLGRVKHLTLTLTLRR
jgi:hypothetical protein